VEGVRGRSAWRECVEGVYGGVYGESLSREIMEGVNEESSWREFMNVF